jgi:hypothetical protein
MIGRAWEHRDIQALTSRKRLFCHPDVGDLHMEQQQPDTNGTASFGRKRGL